MWPGMPAAVNRLMRSAVGSSARGRERVRNKHTYSIKLLNSLLSTFEMPTAVEAFCLASCSQHRRVLTHRHGGTPCAADP